MSKDTHAWKAPQSSSEYTGLKINGEGFSEAIKLSNLTDVVVRDFTASGGSEDCIDVVRGERITFDDGFLYAGEARTFITCKGGIDGLLLRNIRLIGKVRWPWDISLGDHTIYNKGQLMGMKNVVIDNVTHQSGRPIRVLVMDCEVPECNVPVRFYRIPKWIVKLWFKLLG